MLISKDTRRESLSSSRTKIEGRKILDNDPVDIVTSMRHRTPVTVGNLGARQGGPVWPMPFEGRSALSRSQFDAVVCIKKS